MAAQLGFVFIVVDRMARSLTFYEHLGFKFPTEAFVEPHVEAVLPGGEVKICWNQVDAVRYFAPDYEPSPHGRVVLGFRLDSTAEVDALFNKLKSLGYRTDRTPWDAPWGQRYAIVYDPDGNAIELTSPRPDMEG